MTPVVLEGVGLHSAARCRVALARAEGGVEIASAGCRAGIAALRVVRADRGVAVAVGEGGPVVDLVEHLLAALAGLGVYDGVRIEVNGPEVPLLDGSSAALADAILALGAPPRSPPLVVAREATIEVGESRYELWPGEGPRVEVTVAFPGVGEQRASWSGGREEFLAEIAPARTFGFRAEAESLRSVGRAAHVDPRAVVVLEDDGGVRPPYRAPAPDELGRHKLLDLLGDCYLSGGPPVGHVRATRPGHARTQEAMRRAIDGGVLVRREGDQR